jgi:hypothetical protein
VTAVIHDYVERFDINDTVVYIVPDPDPCSPLENDNLGSMVCFHRRYELGHPHNYRSQDYRGWNEVREAIIKDHDVAVILPLFLFDHSGITISTSAEPFCASDSVGWDWGSVGFIYASRARVRENFMVKRLTKEILTRATEVLVAEVREYASYLEGDVYGFIITAKDSETCEECGHEEEPEILESCWGFIGNIDDCRKEARSVAELKAGSRARA